MKGKGNWFNLPSGIIDEEFFCLNPFYMHDLL